jgi:hypothetical protein
VEQLDHVRSSQHGNDHHLLALFDGRDGKTLKEWLKGQ